MHIYIPTRIYAYFFIDTYTHIYKSDVVALYISFSYSTVPNGKLSLL